MKKAICLTIILLVFLTSCRTLEYSTRYYKNLTSIQYPAKAQGTIIPLIEENLTRRAYKVIGEMEFESGASDRHIMNTIQYNGRINGADAIILKEWIKEQETYHSWHPLRFGMSFNHYRACDTGLYWKGHYTIPWNDSYSYVNSKIKAEMIVFLDHDTFGYLGLVFEDVRNTDYLEVKKVLPDSPAMKKGLKPGDKVTDINNYKLDKGLKDFYQNAPIFTVGEEFSIKYLRNSKDYEITLISEKMH